MKTYFIVNPCSGSKNTRKIVDSLTKDADLDYEIIESEYPHHATNIVRTIAERGEDCRIFACGGDGTIFDVVNGAAGYKNVSIGAVPCGSGNDYIKYYGDKKDFLSSDNIIDGVPVAVDLIKFQDKYCINLASIGMDAYVCKRKNKMKFLSRINGSLAYVVSVFITFIFNMGGSFDIIIDDKHKYSNKYLFVVAANGRYYGGSFNPTPSALVDDGYMDVMMMNSVKRYKVITLLKKYQNGTHINIPGLCEIIKAKKISISSEKIIPVNIDGEIFESKDIVFEVIKHGINFIVPKKVFNDLNGQKEGEFVLS